MSVPLLVAIACICGATLAYVLSPLLWPDAAAAAAAAPDAALETLLRRRASAYDAIRELEADYRQGKLDAAEFEAGRAELEERAIAIMRQLDAWERRTDAALTRATAAAPAHRRPARAGATGLRRTP